MKKTTEQFIERAKQIHGDKYDYSLTDYTNSKAKVKIICNKCKNIFEQRPNDHLSGKGCKFCSGTMLNTTEQFIEKAKLIHGDKYDYSLVEYKNNRTKVKIICPVHGIFEQSPNAHLTKRGCKFCSNNVKRTSEQFIKEAKLIHGDRYDYSLVDYKTCKDSVKIKCNTCLKIFEQKPDKHLNFKQGCPFCNISKGEREIEKILKEKGIVNERYKEYDGLVDKNQLNYDFYIPDKNLLIEYNGEQHYKFNSYFHKTLHDFHRQLHHDWLKRKYAQKNGIALLTIPYWEYKNINFIITKVLI